MLQMRVRQEWLPGLDPPNSAIREEWFVCKSHKSNGELPSHPGFPEDGARVQSLLLPLPHLHPVHRWWGASLLNSEVRGVLFKGPIADILSIQYYYVRGLTVLIIVTLLIMVVNTILSS